MGLLKKIRWAYFAVSLIPVILGVVCMVKPAFIAGVICYVAGALLLGFGLFKVIRYFAAKSPLVDSLVVGVLFSLIGFVLIFRKDEVISLIFIFIGILVLLDGVIKLKHAFLARHLGARDWVALLVCAIVVMGLGILMIADPFTGYVPVIILGISIVVDGLQNAYAALRDAFSVSRPNSMAVKRNITVEEFDVHEDAEQ